MVIINIAVLFQFEIYINEILCARNLITIYSIRHCDRNKMNF